MKHKLNDTPLIQHIVYDNLPQVAKEACSQYIPEAILKKENENNEESKGNIKPIAIVERSGAEALRAVPQWPDYFMTGRQLLAQGISEPDYLWEPFLQRQGLAVLGGSSDVGKSSFLRQLCIAVVNGDESFLGHPLKPKYRKAIYLSTEDAPSSMNYILFKQTAGKADSKNMDNLVFIFNNAESVQDIERLLKYSKADLVVIDSLSDIFQGVINDVSSVRKFLNPLSRLCDKYECTVLVLHHTGKRTEKLEASKNNLIGSQGIEAKARLVMELRREGNDSRRVLWFTKGNYLPDEYKRKSMVLNFNETLNFSNTGVTEGVRTLSAKVKFLRREEITIRLVELKKKDLSFKDIHEKLTGEFGSDSVPSLTTLKDWYSQQTGENAEDGRSDVKQ